MINRSFKISKTIIQLIYIIYETEIKIILITQNNIKYKLKKFNETTKFLFF